MGVAVCLAVVGGAALGLSGGAKFSWAEQLPLVSAAAPDLAPVDVQVPVLMYHYIRVNPDPADPTSVELSVAPEAFQAQVDWLADHGYHTVTLRRLLEARRDGERLPLKPVVLTFDDGYADAFTEAAATLGRAGMVGTAFVITGNVGQPGYVTADQLRLMREAGWEIALHTMTHPDLTRVSPERLTLEIEGGAQGLELLSGERPVTFAYPYGIYNRQSMAAVQAAGFLGAVTTRSAYSTVADPTPEIPRLTVHGAASLEQFAALFEG